MAHDSMSADPLVGHGAQLPTLAVLLPLPAGATRAERNVSWALPSVAGATPSSCAEEVVGAAETCLPAAGGAPVPPPVDGTALQSGATEPKSS